MHPVEIVKEIRLISLLQVRTLDKVKLEHFLHYIITPGLRPPRVRLSLALGYRSALGANPTWIVKHFVWKGLEMHFVLSSLHPSTMRLLPESPDTSSLYISTTSPKQDVGNAPALSLCKSIVTSASRSSSSWRVIWLAVRPPCFLFAVPTWTAVCETKPISRPCQRRSFEARHQTAHPLSYQRFRQRCVELRVKTKQQFGML